MVVYSGDLDEVLELADRVVVMYGGMLYDVPPGARGSGTGDGRRRVNNSDCA